MAFATLAEVIKTFISKRNSKVADEKSERLQREDLNPALSSVSPFDVAKRKVLARMKEVASSRKQQLRINKWSGRAAISLTITQYIIGGVLASSFVQESLTPKWVGGLGVLVLIASLFKEQFHPERNADEANYKAFQLLALQRSSEDAPAVLEAKDAAGQDHSDAMIDLLTRLTVGLGEIEKPRMPAT